MHLNKHRPYGHVHGLVGVAFSQDGHFFDGSGRVVVDPEAGGVAPVAGFEPVSPASEAGRSAVELHRNDANPESLIASPEPPPKDDMRLKENKAIKFQWEAFHADEPFPGVAEAKRVLGITE